MAWQALIVPPGLTDAVVASLTRALWRIDLDFLLRHPRTPNLYRSGVRYQAEPIGQERWLSVPAVLDAGAGDCEDLGCWLAAEKCVKAYRAGRFDLRGWLAREATLARELPARPSYRGRGTSGGSVYHILTDVGGGELEDPSRRLGMKGSD